MPRPSHVACIRNPHAIIWSLVNRVLYLQMEFDMNLEKLAYIIGRGFLGGIGIGAVAYGLLFLSLSFGKELPFNTTALFTVFAGTACIFMALKFRENKSDET
jgi:hypothetical protein